jgi:hypothetical protein
MAVRIQKPAVNIREKLAELERPIGLKGSELMKAETAQDAFSLIGARNRNLIINGGMAIDQRNNGGTITSPNVGIACDRWQCATYVTGTTIQRSTTAPPGFTHSYLMTNGTAIQPFASTYYHQIWQIIEGLNIPQLAWGTSSAKPISVSFWVRASITGLYSFGISNGTNPSNSNHTRTFCQTFTINSVNTWEYKTFVIPGCIDGTWNTDNTHGMTISFNLGSGTVFDTTTPGTWITQSAAAAKNATASTIEFNNVTGATFYLTGVQIEEGKVATPFESRSYQQELALCQRYYYDSDYANALYGYNGNPIATATTIAVGSGVFPVTMRATPTVTLPNGADQSGVNVYGATAAHIGVNGFVRITSTGTAFSTNGTPISGRFIASIEL